MLRLREHALTLVPSSRYLQLARHAALVTGSISATLLYAIGFCKNQHVEALESVASKCLYSVTSE